MTELSDHLQDTRPAQIIIFWVLLCWLLMPAYSFAAGNSGAGSAGASVWISVAKAKALHDNDPSVVFVDIRPPESVYSEVRLPGALQVPPHALKHKAYLRNSDVVLVDQGFKRRHMEMLVQALRSEGINASAISGGLVAWRDAGGNLIGSPDAISRMDLVTKDNVLAEENLDAAMKIVLMAEKKKTAPTDLFKNAEIVGHSANTAVKTLKKQSKQRIPVQLVASINGSGYDAVRARHKNNSGYTVFYLKGGWQEYRAYMAERPQMLKSSEARTRYLEGCVPCAKKQNLSHTP